MAKFISKENFQKIWSKIIRRADEPWVEFTVDLMDEKWDQNTWYPVLFRLLETRGAARVDVRSPLRSDYGKPAWSTHRDGFFARTIFSMMGSDWGAVLPFLTVEYSKAAQIADNYVPISNVGQITAQSLVQMYLRGGGKYDCRVTGIWRTLISPTWPEALTPIVVEDSYTPDFEGARPVVPIQSAGVVAPNEGYNPYDGAVTMTKLGSDVQAKLVDGVITTDEINKICV